jgi:hypothetical protein
MPITFAIFQIDNSLHQLIDLYLMASIFMFDLSILAKIFICIRFVFLATTNSDMEFTYAFKAI